jgi:hypothetical protein
LAITIHPDRPSEMSIDEIIRHCSKEDVEIDLRFASNPPLKLRVVGLFPKPEWIGGYRSSLDLHPESFSHN